HLIKPKSLGLAYIRRNVVGGPSYASDARNPLREERYSRFGNIHITIFHLSRLAFRGIYRAAVTTERAARLARRSSESLSIESAGAQPAARSASSGSAVECWAGFGCWWSRL